MARAIEEVGKVKDSFNAQEFRARRSGGVFTPAERARIQRQQDFASRNIYLQKHDRQRH